MVYFLGIYGTFTGSFSKFNPVSDFLYITWPVWVIIISCTRTYELHSHPGLPTTDLTTQLPNYR